MQLRSHQGLIALLGASLLAVASVVAISSGSAGADQIDDCTATSGAVVAVDFSHFGGAVERGCDAHPSTGYALLHNAGFTTTGTQHDGPAFICRIGNPDFKTGTQYPLPVDEPCTATPQATAYWSYWIAPAGQHTWTYSTLGVQSDVPTAGEVEAWVFGGTDIAGTTGGPSFTPDSVRAGGAASSSSSTSSSAPVSTAHADLTAAAKYLTGQLTDGNHVDDGSGGNSYPQSVNVALGLAALGGQDATLTKILTALHAHIADYVYPNGTSAPPAPDAAANLALLDEVTGSDPSTLLSALTGNVCTAAGSSGFCSAAGDFYGASHPYTQALAILALVRGGSTPPAATVSRLEQLQCADGSFASLMRNAGDACDPDVTTTAAAILALKGVSGTDSVVAKALDYLDGAQQGDGSYLPYTGASNGDSGTTGLAAQALLAAGHADQAASAVNWLADRQNSDGGLSPDATSSDSDLYSSTAVLPLAGKHLDTLTYTVQTASSSSTSSSPAPSVSVPTTGAASKTVDLTKGSSYLVTPANLLGGQYYEAFAGSGFADFGLTMDGAFALAATGKNDAALAKIVGFIANGKDGSGRSINDWTSIGTPFAGGGSLGKEALLAEVTGYDPTDFGGQNLITALDSTVCAAATTSVDTVCAGTGNYANSTSVFSQALGVIAQLRAGDTTGAASPIGYLQSLQKTNGAWPSLIPDSGDSDVDSTAMALMALSLAPGTEAAVAKGIAWIATQQESDGGFPGAAGDSTNSAALAVQGLSLDKATYAAPIAKALTFLADQQNVDGGFNVASSGQRGSDIRASTQVVGGATGISFGTLSRDVHGLASAAAGAKYLVSQLVDGDHLVNAYGPDYGLTADLAIALAAANTQDATLTKVVRYLAAHVADYADPAGTSQYPGPYSGAVAKLALIAEITGQKPTAFGGFNLLKTLTDHVCAAADADGSCTAAGDFYQSYSTVSQSLAVLALAKGGVTPPDTAVTRLASLQCPDGGFASLLIAAGDTCTSDVDTTGYALQALLRAPSQHSAAGLAESYLLAAQQRDGGYVGAAGENSNSTALAVQGLLAADRAGLDPTPVRLALAAGTDAVAAGKKFLYPLQNTNGGFGINAASPDSDVRSTTQAVPALAGATLSALGDPLTITNGPGTGGATTGVPVAGPSPSGGSASASAGASSAGGGSLAFTGSQPITLLELGILLLLAGGGAMLLARRRPAAARRH